VADPNAATLDAGWSRTPGRLTHDLVGHPALQAQALARVAQRLPAERIESHFADLPLVHPTGAVRRISQPADEVVRDLATRTAWVMLAGLWEVPPYDGLAEDTIGLWIGASADAEGGLRARHTTVFAASAGAVVPVHFDVQHNVLLQITGTKRVFLGGSSPGGSLERVLEAGIASGVRNLHELPPEVLEYELSPGVGLFIPAYVPHWIVGGADVSISLSCSWETAWTLRETRIRRVNARMRRLGLRPPPPGLHPGRDRTKDAAAQLYSKSRRAPRRLHAALSGGGRSHE